ncbi:hypothetical protein [Streptomyces sp. NPDC059943]
MDEALRAVRLRVIQRYYRGAEDQLRTILDDIDTRVTELLLLAALPGA